jgi:hypothetical protein
MRGGNLASPPPTSVGGPLPLSRLTLEVSFVLSAQHSVQLVHGLDGERRRLRAGCKPVALQ